jgi:quercetin dioxygenase-like cupin family protein
MQAKQMIARHIHHGEEAFYVLEGATVVTRMRPPKGRCWLIRIECSADYF